MDNEKTIVNDIEIEIHCRAISEKRTEVVNSIIKKIREAHNPKDRLHLKISIGELVI